MKYIINPILTYNDYRKFIKFVNNKFELPINHFNPLEYFKISDFEGNVSIDNFINSFFTGRYVSIPEFKLKNPELNLHTRFEDFTSRDEVKNISLWTLAALSMLSYEEPRLGKELEILQASNPRDGRLDITVLDGNDLLILEAKVSLRSALSEGRFRYQIPEYKKQAEKTIRELKLPYKLNVFLIVGGEETDLYPPNHVDCTTGKIGDLAKIFYDNLEQYNIKFISANALWCLLSYAIYKNKQIYWKDIVSIFSKENIYGLLTAGKVYKEGKELLIEKLHL